MREPLDGQRMMKRFLGSTINVLLVLTVFWPTVASAQEAFPSDEQLGLTAGIILSAVGSTVCSGVNGYKLALGRPSTIGGIFGMIFGVSTIAFLGVTEAQDDMDVSNAGILLFGSVALASTILGGWSLLEARSISTTSQVNGLNTRPFISVKRGTKDCLIGVSFDY